MLLDRLFQPRLVEPLRITTLNLNGIRSAAKKGFFSWARRQNPDVLCLQETRAHGHQLPRSIARPRGFHASYREAVRPGYSGVGIWSRQAPDRVIDHLGDETIDREGRYLRADFGKLSVISWYLPSGSSSPERQIVKLAVMETFAAHLRELAAEGRDCVVCGDWNIAHRPIDLTNWRANQKYSGFLPEERAWMDRVLGEVGWVDAYRAVHPETVQYTWWSNRGQARKKNVGWRIDYQIATPGLAKKARGASVYTRTWFSDHAPMTIEYDLG